MNKLIVVIGLVFLGCSKVETTVLEDKNTKEIINVLVDKYAKPLTPPPPIGISGKEYEQFLVDRKSNKNRWLNKKMEVAIDPRLSIFDMNDKYLDTILFKEFIGTVQKRIQNKDSKRIDFEITPTRSNVISFLDTTLVSKEKYRNSDVLLAFSRVYFNDDYSKAIIKVHFNRGWSSGFLVYCFLEKGKNGNWVLRYEK